MGLTEDRMQQGFAQFTKMAGAERAQELSKNWREISPDFQQCVIGILAGEIWTRTQLDLRTRSLVTIAGLTALGKNKALALNVEMALQNGASRLEIRETMLQIAFYAGFPAAWEGLQIAEQIFKQIDQSAPVD